MALPFCLVHSEKVANPTVNQPSFTCGANNQEQSYLPFSRLISTG